MQSDGYLQTSKELLSKAKAELVQDDLLQASEKLWGAAAHAVKAIAKRRRWPHDSHRRLFEAVNRLSIETGDRDLTTFFEVAAALHVNFYEVVRPREFIENDLQVVEGFTRRLESL